MKIVNTLVLVSVALCLMSCGESIEDKEQTINGLNSVSSTSRTSVTAIQPGDSLVIQVVQGAVAEDDGCLGFHVENFNGFVLECSDDSVEAFATYLINDPSAPNGTIPSNVSALSAQTSITIGNQTIENVCGVQDTDLGIFVGNVNNEIQTFHIVVIEEESSTRAVRVNVEDDSGPFSFAGLGLNCNPLDAPL